MSQLLPLSGRCVLVTRARNQATALVSRIEAEGGEVYAFATISIVDPESWAPLDEAIARLDCYRWVVITSPNGAEKVASRLTAAGRGPGELAATGLKVAAVGSATAQRLADLGIGVDLIPPEFRGAALPAAMAPYLAPGDRVLMPRANLADPALADRLREQGAVVDDVVAYRTLAEDGGTDELRAALLAGRITYATFTSGSTVGNLLERLGSPQWLEPVRIAVIGPETKKAAEAAGLTVHVEARQATIDGLVNAIVEDSIHLQGS